MLKIFKKKKIDMEAFIADCMQGLHLVTESHKNKWHLGQEQSWKVDEARGNIAFLFADGVVATAPAQIIGTLNAQDNTFTWGWDHAAVVPALQQHAAQVKAFGVKYGCKELTTQSIACTEKRAWEYTALAMLLTEANGAYRVEAAPGTFVFMTFGEVALTQRAA